MTTDQLITLLIGIGAGGMVKELVTGAWRWVTGRQATERSTIQRAWADLDAETMRRRRAEEYAYRLRSLMIERGWGTELPEFPSTIEPPRS